jgi:hypothetical protein
VWVVIAKGAEQVRWTEWLMCWLKPSHWRDHHPFKAEAKPVDRPDRHIHPQYAAGAESHDRVDDVSRK